MPIHSIASAALLDVTAAPLRLGGPVCFVRRLVAERRVRFVKLGRYVRFDPADLGAPIAAGVVAPLAPARVPGGHYRRVLMHGGQPDADPRPSRTRLGRCLTGGAGPACPGAGRTSCGWCSRRRSWPRCGRRQGGEVLAVRAFVSAAAEAVARGAGPAAARRAAFSVSARVTTGVAVPSIGAVICSS